MYKTILLTLDGTPTDRAIIDRKSTRLNSSHLGISYAVFCLKKRKQTCRSRDHSGRTATDLKSPRVPSGPLRGARPVEPWRTCTRVDVCLVANLFFFNDTATTEIYTLSLHDALPISPCGAHQRAVAAVVWDAGIEDASGRRRPWFRPRLFARQRALRHHRH